MADVELTLPSTVKGSGPSVKEFIRQGPPKIEAPTSNAPQRPLNPPEPKGQGGDLGNAFVLTGIGPDRIVLPFERTAQGNYGPEAAATRLISFLASIYEAHPEYRDELARAGFVYGQDGSDQLASYQEDPQEGGEEDREPEGVVQEALREGDEAEAEQAPDV